MIRGAWSLASAAALLVACGPATALEARYGPVASRVCGALPSDAPDGALVWRSLEPGTTFTADCVEPRLPVCLGVAGDPEPAEPEDLMVTVELEDASRGRNAVLPLVSIPQGRLLAGELPLLRGSLLPGDVIDVRVREWSDESDVELARRIRVGAGDGTGCTFTVLEEEPPPLDRFARFCGTPVPQGSPSAVSMVAPVRDRDRVETTPQAFFPARPALYVERGIDVCDYRAHVPVCIEVRDPEVGALRQSASGEATALTSELVIEERDGSRWAYGNLVVDVAKRPRTLITHRLEAFAIDAAPDARPFLLEDRSFVVPGPADFVSCDVF